MNENKQHKKDFLNQQIGKNTGFEIPDNYFNDLENDLMSKLITKNLPEKCGFEAPEYYFDNLEDTVLNKINAQKSKVISFRKRLIKFSSFAAAASVILFITFQFINILPPEQTNITIDEWFDNSDITTDELALLFEDQDFSENDLSYATENNNIEDYLDNIDNSSLLDEIQ
ncbi:hypothetical protein ACSIGC_04325 [Tenacibaculum sp. ZS6-P6]|uniref:hypothetical protein n=1 Tax=Tenacibaculum sp. ZS6-P6 TaxID=3447503 RepID=UPI003F95FBEB